MKKLKTLTAIITFFMVISGIKLDASAENQILYTALGDSIAAGYALPTTEYGYVSLLSVELDLTPQNLAVPGMNSKQLLEQIQGLQGDELENLEKARLITVSIGSNDILGPFLNMFSSSSMMNNYDMNSLTENPESIIDIAGDFIDVGLESLLVPYVDVFKNNLPLIVDEIKKINPKAQLIFTDFYNPFKNLEFSQLDISVNEMTDGLMQLLNDVLYTGDGGEYLVARVYDAFENAYAEGNNPVNVSTLSSAFSFDPHPNVYGHKLIRESISDVVSTEKLYKKNIEENTEKNSEAQAASGGVISENTEQNIQPEQSKVIDENQKQSPETGFVPSSVLIILMIALVSCMGIIFIKVKKE